MSVGGAPPPPGLNPDELAPPTAGWARRATRTVLPGVVAFIVVFGGWEFGVRYTHISATELVAPSAIFRELWRAPGFLREQCLGHDPGGFLGLPRGLRRRAHGCRRRRALAA